MKQEIENFYFVEASLHWSFKSLSEISFINKARPPKEIELVNGRHLIFIEFHCIICSQWNILN